MCSSASRELPDLYRSPSVPQSYVSSSSTDPYTDANHNASTSKRPDILTTSSPAVSDIVDKGAHYLRDRIFNRDSGFERLTPQHRSAFETLCRSRPSHQMTSTPSRAAIDSPDAAGPADAEMSELSTQRTAKAAGKRRLSSGRQDDSSSGGGRQRKCSSSQQYQTTHQQSPGPAFFTVKQGSSVGVDEDSVIADYLSFRVENMDLQSEMTSSFTRSTSEPSPCWQSMLKDGVDVTEEHFENQNTAGIFKTPESSDARGICGITADSAKSKTPVGEPPRIGVRRYRKPLVAGRTVNATRHVNKSNSGGIESFFDEMGMDQSTLHSAASPALSAFENVSSVGTSTLESRTSNGGSERIHEALLDSLEIDAHESGASTSVVERNARIIKWLCSIRKASVDSELQFDDGFV